MALSHGRRGLPGGSSLARLLAEKRGRRNSGGLPRFNINQILKWADSHHEQTGMWPTHASGSVSDAPQETWLAVDKALRDGKRGLQGGSSLARLLERRRGVPLQQRRRPPLSVETILAWADAHHQRTGKWPDQHSGTIPAARGETWGQVQHALKRGERGLRGNRSLAKLLAEHRDVRYHLDLPDFSIRQILTWADAHFKRHGVWPTRNSGPIEDARGETWNAVALALARGTRGLEGGLSLARLLAERRGVRNHGDLPRFSTAGILAWADAYQRRTGMWPTHSSGVIAEMPAETWAIVDRALRNGLRGMRRGSSLARLLKRERGVIPKQRRKPPLTMEMILGWGDEYHRRHGHWPRQTSGRVHPSSRDSWTTVDDALRNGKRGLPAGGSLGKLWAQYRGARNVHSIPKLSSKQILCWADAHYRRTGAWPQVRSGPIAESPADNWLSVDASLRLGLRGLRGGSSLKRFLNKHRPHGSASSAGTLPSPRRIRRAK